MYMYMNLLKLKAYKLFENSDADLSCLFLKKPTCWNRIHLSLITSCSFDNGALKSSLWFGNNIKQITSEGNSINAWIGALTIAINII